MVLIGELIYQLYENPLFKGIRKSDIVNHVKTVVNLIGSPGLYEDKTITLDIYDFKAQLPKDFKARTAVRRVLNSNVSVPLMHNTDQFYKQYEKYDADEQAAKVDLLYTHKIVGNFIWVDFEEGTIEMAYTAFKTDEEGYPVIMGDDSVRLAVEWYVKQKYLEALWMSGYKPKVMYDHALQQYQWYIGQASNSINTPDPLEAEALGNAIVRLIPQTDNVESAHKYDSQKERLRTDYWRG